MIHFNRNSIVHTQKARAHSCQIPINSQKDTYVWMYVLKLSNVMHISATKHNRIINSKKCVWPRARLPCEYVLKICRAQGVVGIQEYSILCFTEYWTHTHNNIHHYSSFTAAKVIFFGFSLNAYVCLPAHSHSSSVPLAPIPFLLLLLNSRPTFVYRCAIPSPFVPLSRCLFSIQSRSLSICFTAMDRKLRT